MFPPFLQISGDCQASPLHGFPPTFLPSDHFIDSSFPWADPGSIFDDMRYGPPSPSLFPLSSPCPLCRLRDILWFFLFLGNATLLRRFFCPNCCFSCPQHPLRFFLLSLLLFPRSSPTYFHFTVLTYMILCFLSSDLLILLFLLLLLRRENHCVFSLHMTAGFSFLFLPGLKEKQLCMTQVHVSRSQLFHLNSALLYLEFKPEI